MKTKEQLMQEALKTLDLGKQDLYETGMAFIKAQQLCDIAAGIHEVEYYRNMADCFFELHHMYAS